MFTCGLQSQFPYCTSALRGVGSGWSLHHSIGLAFSSHRIHLLVTTPLRLLTHILAIALVLGRRRFLFHDTPCVSRCLASLASSFGFPFRPLTDFLFFLFFSFLFLVWKRSLVDAGLLYLLSVRYFFCFFWGRWGESRGQGCGFCFLAFWLRDALTPL